MFLCHSLPIWIMEYLTKCYAINVEFKGKVVLQMLMTLFISYIGFKYIETPLYNIRKGLQSRVKNDVMVNISLEKTYFK